MDYSSDDSFWRKTPTLLYTFDYIPLSPLSFGLGYNFKMITFVYRISTLKNMLLLLEIPSLAMEAFQ